MSYQRSGCDGLHDSTCEASNPFMSAHEILTDCKRSSMQKPDELNIIHN